MPSASNVPEDQRSLEGSRWLTVPQPVNRRGRIIERVPNYGISFHTVQCGSRSSGLRCLLARGSSAAGIRAADYVLGLTARSPTTVSAAVLELPIQLRITELTRPSVRINPLNHCSSCGPRVISGQREVRVHLIVRTHVVNIGQTRLSSRN